MLPNSSTASVSPCFTPGVSPAFTHDGCCTSHQQGLPQSRFHARKGGSVWSEKLTCTGCPPTKRSRCRPGAHSSSCRCPAHRRRTAWPVFRQRVSGPVSQPRRGLELVASYLGSGKIMATGEVGRPPVKSLATGGQGLELDVVRGGLGVDLHRDIPVVGTGGRRHVGIRLYPLSLSLQCQPMSLLCSCVLIEENKVTTTTTITNGGGSKEAFVWETKKGNTDKLLAAEHLY